MLPHLSLPATSSPNISAHYHSSPTSMPSDTLRPPLQNSPTAAACPPAPHATNDNSPDRPPPPIPSSIPIRVAAPPPSPPLPRDSAKPPAKAAPASARHIAAQFLANPSLLHSDRK